MNAGADARLRRLPVRVLAATIVAATWLVMLAACGAPARIHTLDNEPDRARIAPVNKDTDRLLAACRAIDPKVRTLLPDIGSGGEFTRPGLAGSQCEWPGTPDTPDTPELIVGLLARSNGGGLLDQTTAVLDGERAIAGAGERAVLDPQTRTLYVLENGRLWYIQVVGSRLGGAAVGILASLGRTLVPPASAR